MLEWAQLPISLEEWNARIAAQQDLFKKSQLLPGVRKLLGDLSQHTSPRVHLAIASSAGRTLFNIKTAHLPEDVFSRIPDSCRVFGDDASMFGKKGKPAPDIFLQALERINDSLAPGEEKITSAARRQLPRRRRRLLRRLFYPASAISRGGVSQGLLNLAYALAGDRGSKSHKLLYRRANLSVNLSQESFPIYSPIWRRPLSPRNRH